MRGTSLMTSFMLFIAAVIVAIILLLGFGKMIFMPILGMAAEHNPDYIGQQLRSYIVDAQVTPGSYEAKLIAPVKTNIYIKKETDENYVLHIEPLEIFTIDGNELTYPIPVMKGCKILPASSGYMEIFNNNQFLIRKSSESEGNYLDAFIKTKDNSVEPRVRGVQMEPDKWYFVAVTWDKTDLKIYIDGVIKQTKKREIDLTETTVQARIGAGEQTNPNIHFWSGLIDNVAFYSRALTEYEIKADHLNGYATGSGLVDFWNLNDGTGTNADNTERDNDGTVMGPEWVKRGNGYALFFNGKKNYISIPRQPELKNGFTFEAWVNWKPSVHITTGDRTKAVYVTKDEDCTIKIGYR